MDGSRVEFGKYFRSLRLMSEMSLRKFCLENKFDASTISKIERGIYPAPRSNEKMLEYADALEISEGGDEWIKLFDLWTRARNQTDIETISNSDLPSKLPILFRTQDNKDLSSDKLNEVVKIVQTS